MGEGWWRRVVALLDGRREEAEMEEEMRFHLEKEAAKLEREGLDARAARTEALRRFGGVDRMKERTRDERGTRLVEDTARDIRYALRSLSRTPGFTMVAVITLSLGIGATTAMFTLVDGVLLRPLPYPEADRLVAIWERTEDGRSLLASYHNFADWRAASERVAYMAAFTSTRPTTMLTANGGVRARLTRVTADFFSVAGVAPTLGRLPGADEHRPGAAPVAVVSHGFWQTGLGGPTSLAGVTVDVQGTIYDVIGVMPPGFALPDAAEVWISLDRAVPWTVRSNHVVAVVGRLAPGASVDGVAEELEATHRAIRRDAPEVETVGVTVRPYRAEVVGDVGRGLGLLLAASGILLLVACTNLASMLMARGAGRIREMGVRASLGASRGRLIRQLGLESLTLASLGGVGGVLTSYGILLMTRHFDPGAVPRLEEVSIDPRALVFTVTVTVFVTLAFGLLPAIALTARNLATSFRQGRTGYGRRARAAWRAIMGIEVALAVVLLVSGGLLLRSLGAILARDGGFRSEGVVTARVELPLGKYETNDDVRRVFEELLGELEAQPAIRSAGLTLLLPIPGMGAVSGGVTVDGERTETRFHYRVADAGYFSALGIPLLQGRLFSADDGPQAPHVAVVDRAMAETLWPGQDPLGRTFNPGGMDPWPDTPLTVVGVVGDALPWNRTAGSTPGYYVHYRQRPTFLALFGADLVAATDGTAGGATRLRETIRALDRDIPVEIGTLDGLVARSAGDRRFNAFILSAFALAALLLAAVGIYGVVSYSVARRVREMGIRLALGARPQQVRGTVQRDALTTVLAGAAVGSGVAAALAPRLRSLLFDVSPLDATSFVVALAVLGTFAWAASWIPARRGTRLDPARVLRQE